MKSNRTILPDAQTTSLRVGTADIPFTTFVRRLGLLILDNFILDKHKHSSTVCRSVFVQIRRLSSVRQYLTVEATKALAPFFVSKLGCCNSLLSGWALYCLIIRLQTVQNSAAKLVFKERKRGHVQPLLQALHWLPDQARIDYKLSAICHSFFSNSSPAYFSDLLTVCTPSRQFRSSADTRIFPIAHVRTTTFGQRCFSDCVPKRWNSLPSDIRHIQSSHAFTTALKTHLYKQYHNR